MDTQPRQGPDGRWYTQDGRQVWDGQRWLPTQPSDVGAAAPRLPGEWPIWARPFESAAPRARFVLISFAVLLVVLSLTIALDLFVIGFRASVGGGLSSDQQVVVDLAKAATALLYMVALALCVVGFCVWIHRVYRNLPALGAAQLRFSPRWAVGGWFVPVLNLWRPYQVMREIWQRTLAQPTGLLRWWWAAWLVSNLVSDVALRSNLSGGSNDVLDAVSNSLYAAAAVLAILIVRKITAWELRRVSRA